MELAGDSRAGRGAPAGLSWADLLEQWQLIELDLHELYGIDVEDRELLRARSWRWGRTRIVGLLTADSRLARHFTAITASTTTS